MTAGNALRKSEFENETVVEIAARLAPRFAANAAKADEGDLFVAWDASIVSLA